MRVIVIDDYEDVADMLATALRIEGVSVEAVSNAFGRMRDVERWEGVDVAIVDLSLPGDVKGGDILTWLAQNCPTVRRVAFTALPREQNHVDADFYIEKGGAGPQAILKALGFRPDAQPPTSGKRSLRLRLREPASDGLVWLACAYAVATTIAMLPTPDGRRIVSAVANLGIVAGYLFVGVFVAPFVVARRHATRVAGAIFFVTCALTHLENFLHAASGTAASYTEPFHVLVHTVQVVSVFAFTWSLWTEFVHHDRSWPPRLDFARMFSKKD